MLDAKAKKAAIEIAKKLINQAGPENLKKAIVDPNAFKNAITNPKETHEEIKQSLIDSARTISEEEVAPEKKEELTKSAIRNAFTSVENAVWFNVSTMAIPVSALAATVMNLMPGGITTEQGITLWAGAWVTSVAMAIAMAAGRLVMGADDTPAEPTQKPLDIKEIKELIKEQIKKQEKKVILLASP